jgi:hypothetical protein
MTDLSPEVLSELERSAGHHWGNDEVSLLVKHAPALIRAARERDELRAGWRHDRDALHEVRIERDAAIAERDRLHDVLARVSGALVDAATVQVEPYDEGVRALTAERDRLRAENAKLREADRAGYERGLTDARRCIRVLWDNAEHEDDAAILRAALEAALDGLQRLASRRAATPPSAASPAPGDDAND